MTSLDFLVRKNQLAVTELRQTAETELLESQIRLHVDKFALTSNNITYAAFGEAMSYWDFFPAADGWGRIPVWGFAHVVESRHADIQIGEQFYGYFPMSTSVILQAHRVSSKGFMDGAEHRAALHAVYNSYTRCDTDPFYSRETEDLQALLRPLFITSWLIDDFLADNDFFGAGDSGTGMMLLSSASSKTAYGTAFQLAQRSGIEVVGLTSPANLEFCRSLGCYHRVLSYDQLEQIEAEAACVYIDFAGNSGLRKRIHTRFTHLKYSSSIGGTHLDQLGGAKDLPGPRATLFFAPAHIKKRNAEWGADMLGQRLLLAWRDFIEKVRKASWLTVEHHSGEDAVRKAFAEVLAGHGNPRSGHILSLVSAGTS